MKIFDILRSGFMLSGKADKKLIYGLLWAAAEGFLIAVLYMVLYLFLKTVFEQQSTLQSIVVSAIVMITLVLFRIFVGSQSMTLIFSGAYAMMARARLRLVDHLRHLPMGWFVRQRSGDIAARLTSDIELIENVWAHFLGMFVSGLTMPLFLLCFLMYIDWRLALVMLITLPIALAALILALQILTKPSEQLLKAGATAQAALYEYIQGIAVIRSFGRFGQMWGKLKTVLGNHYGAMLEAEAKPAPFVAVYGFLLELGYIALIFAGIWGMFYDVFSAERIVLFFILTLPIYRQLFDTGLSFMLLRFADTSFKRIQAMMNEPVLAEPDVVQQPQSEDIVFDNVSFSYDQSHLQQETATLNHLTCVIPAKKMTAIVGPSGAGKSTLVHLIGRLWDVNSGSIRLGNVDLRDIGGEQLQRHIAMVFQDVFLFSGTVLDNLRLGKPNADREEVIAVAKRAQAHDFIMALPYGYETQLDEGGHSLSGGERQRLSIARALLKNAPILLLDEATASVDTSAEAEIQEAISELAADRTVVVIAHRLRSIRHADQILVLNQGCLAETGTHEELLSQHGLYSELWQQQEEVAMWKINASLE